MRIEVKKIQSTHNARYAYGALLLPTRYYGTALAKTLRCVLVRSSLC